MLKMMIALVALAFSTTATAGPPAFDVDYWPPVTTATAEFSSVADSLDVWIYARTPGTALVTVHDVDKEVARLEMWCWRRGWCLATTDVPGTVTPDSVVVAGDGELTLTRLVVSPAGSWTPDDAAVDTVLLDQRFAQRLRPITAQSFGLPPTEGNALVYVRVVRPGVVGATFSWRDDGVTLERGRSLVVALRPGWVVIEPDADGERYNRVTIYGRGWLTAAIRRVVVAGTDAWDPPEVR